jgi:hypothetical protein
LEKSPVLIAGIVFIVSMTLLSALITPLFATVKYVSVCSNPKSLVNILPLRCGRSTLVTFRLNGNTVVAEIDELEMTVATITGGHVIVKDKYLWEMLQACCNITYPPEKHVDLAGLVKGVLVSALISTLISVISARAITSLVRRRSNTIT